MCDVYWRNIQLWSGTIQWASQKLHARLIGPNNDELVFSNRWKYRVNDIINQRSHHVLSKVCRKLYLHFLKLITFSSSTVAYIIYVAMRSDAYYSWTSEFYLVFFNLVYCFQEIYSLNLNCLIIFNQFTTFLLFCRELPNSQFET